MSIGAWRNEELDDQLSHWQAERVDWEWVEEKARYADHLYLSRVVPPYAERGFGRTNRVDENFEESEAA